MELTFIGIRGNTMHLKQCSMVVEYISIYIKLKNMPINTFGCLWI